MSAEDYNRSKLNVLWSMLSLPKAFPGFQVLDAASTPATLSVDPERVDWAAFTSEVREFQGIGTASAPDGKLGPDTLRSIISHYNHQFPLPDTAHIGDAVLRLRRIAESQLGVEEYAGTEHNPRILAYAKQIGYGGIAVDETAWCSIFANWCAMRASLPYSGKLNARSWLEVGQPVEDPEPGDVVVFWRGNPNSWEGHVALIDSMGDGVINVLGGNQSNRVCVLAYQSARLIGYRRLG